MAKNDFKAFATDRNANVMSQEEWEALPALLSGFTAGKASSAQVNKVIRQASFIAAALAQYTANKSGQDVLDNGDLNGFITKMSAAFGKDFQALDATLTALAGLATGANKLPYFTGTDTASQTDLTSVGRDIIGKSTIADILTYLGLGEGSALPVGVPVPWPSATPPTGWIKCNGAPFSAAQYPELAKVYPALKLPDLRGEFIRGWDDGRGVDSGRVVLTGQSQSVQLHTHDLAMAYSSDIGYKDMLGTTPDSDLIAIKYMINVTTFNGSGSIYLKANDSTGTETRPRNLAFNYIVRAV
ncbi:phage tail protein [Escherichia coli]|uniref:tail fiber protein n=1 Tax=Escherichia coli TaxID=562 RepID=UPI0009279F40|nr:tail fiber protein [Escherichia coli]OJL66009.1 phage tail protein [Escherichia coli]